VQQLQTLETETAWSITVSSDSVYVTGQTAGWLGQTYEGRYQQWTGDEGDYFWGVRDDLTYFGGTYWGAGDAFISRFSQDGEFQWTRLLGTNTEDTGLQVFADDRSGAYIVGETQSQLGSSASNERHAGGVDIFAARYNADGALTWKEQWGSDGDDHLVDVAVNADGEALLVGTTTGVFPDENRGALDAWIMQLK